MSKLYELKLFTELAGQGCVNRYYYWGATDTPLSEELADSFEALTMPKIQAVSSIGVEFKGVAVRDVFTGSDNHLLNLNNYTGNVTNDDTLPPFVGYGFGLNAVSGFRQGGKRYAGVTEGYGNNGEVDNPGLETNLSILGNTHILSYLLSSGLELIPMLARKELGQAAWKFASIVAGTYKRVTTQNSRKANSGGGAILPAYASKSVTNNGDNTITYNVGTYNGASTTKSRATNHLYIVPDTELDGDVSQFIAYSKTIGLDGLEVSFPRTEV